MKDAFIKLIESFARDSNIRIVVIVVPSIIIILFFAKGCFEYDACTDICNRGPNEVIIKCLEHCNGR